MRTDTQVWLITGAGRGMGLDFVRAALAAGHAVVATGRNPDAVHSAIGERPMAASVGCPAGCHGAGRCGVRGRGGGAAVRPHRCAGQQCGQLLRRLLRGADARADRAPTGDGPDRPDERHPRRAARHAAAAVRAHHLDLIRRGPVRLRVQLRLLRREVRPGGLDGVAAAGGRAVRYPHHHRQPGLLPHRSPDAGVGHLRHAVDPGLRRRDTRSACGGTRT